jgi:hypothetical protein
LARKQSSIEPYLKNISKNKNKFLRIKIDGLEISKKIKENI